MGLSFTTIGPVRRRSRTDRARPRALTALRGPLAVKRGLDVVAATLGLLALAPLFAVVGLLILSTSGRPVFFLQERVGKGGRLFRMAKFRSMRRDAEHDTGPVWATDRDVRCTRIGGWLRRTNLDEFPQLWNVLKGEMSLVGPRPERPVFVDRFRATLPGYDQRHAVAVGMTGWAQVHGFRGRTSLAKRLAADLEYRARWSIGLDLRILFMTVQHVACGKTCWAPAKPRATMHRETASRRVTKAARADAAPRA